MFVLTLALLAIFASVANAHFRLLYPPPRGDFVDDQEPNFCGGYNNAANRTTFPLSGGFFSIKTGHPSWTAGVLISTAENPDTFDDFKASGQDELALNYFKGPEPGAGTFCIPLDIAAANITGAVDGANVTIQIVVQATDGNLYQCADLTLVKDLKIDSNVSCVNETSATTSNSTNSTGSSHSGAVVGLSASQMPALLSAAMALFGVAFALL